MIRYGVQSEARFTSVKRIINYIEVCCFLKHHVLYYIALNINLILKSYFMSELTAFKLNHVICCHLKKQMNDY